ncbi:ABC transporter ATP-binding protein [archaeon]|nr:MAG: ABC transporter ATP-binding protein [archaeon]RLG65629.1 MAG: ABC transporter ATP-binding protein [archaeon]RLG66177.1 MAG: ABC transporter ATP-binding protein [archaeon]HDM23318.1 ABC transporter ATP-binding protein [Candidatus Bathyarchaeota archaeon]
MALLEVDSLKVYFSTIRGYVRAVDGVSFEIGKGEAFGLAGESGCGKTTTALSILRLLPSNGEIKGGKILFDGMDIVKLDEETLRKEIRWKRISIVFQGAMNALNPVFTIGDQIVEAILAHENVTKAKALSRTKKLLKLVGLSPMLVKRYPHELSGGMKQRVMIAMALACNPDLVIADEPTTALDVIVQAQILNLLKDLRKKLNLSVILISHDLSIIAELCDKVAIMYAGKIVEIGTVYQIFKNPKHPYTRGLIQSFPNIRAPKSEFKSIPGAPPNLLHPPPGCRFHPRCPYTKQICREEEPEMVEVEPGHFVACHFREVIG